MDIRTLVRFHFKVAVWLSILGGIAVFSDPEIMMPDEEGLFGPLRNNLLIAIGYLLFGQIGLWYLRYLKGGYFEALVMGYTFAATAVGSKVYAEVNGLPISGAFTLALAYIAFAHFLYFGLGQPHGQALPSSGNRE